MLIKIRSIELYGITEIQKNVVKLLKFKKSEIKMRP